MTAEGPAVTTAVVVCAYTTARWGQLQAAVRTVLAQTVSPAEVVVVVDHSDELLAMAAALERQPTAGSPGVRVLPNSGPRGLSGARNTGVQAASAEVVAFLDDDAVASPTWLAELSAHFASADVIGVGGRILPDWAGREPAWLPPEFLWVVGCSYTGLPQGTAEVRNPIGASMAFRRAALQAVGGFSTAVGRVGTTPLGCEETELSIRLAHRVPGSRILYEPRAVVHHHVAPERARWAYFRRRCWSEGLSKALVAGLADPRRALSAERRYATRVLPAGIARDLGAAVRTRDGWRLASAATSGTGLAITALGYAAGRLGRSRSRRLARAARPPGPLTDASPHRTAPHSTTPNGAAPNGAVVTASPAPAALTSPGG
jgi:GT2 family glycosyltransferase